MKIKTHKQLRQLARLNFCYKCGEDFKKEKEKTRDHVPPKSIFLKKDRTRPLILSAHNDCNNDESWADEIMGELITFLNGIHPPKNKLKVKLKLAENLENNQPVLVSENINIRGFIWRCVKAFHAALYKEYLPQETRNWVDPPVPPGTKNNKGITFEKLPEQFRTFVKTIKQNRMAGKTDRIECFNGKCIYECVWEQMDGGEWSCIFALNIYDWKNLGDPTHQKRRGCVGFYMPDTGLPEVASTGIARTLEMPISNLEPLDPFGD